MTKLLLTPSQMSQAEKASAKLGVSLSTLMDNAGASLCSKIEEISDSKALERVIFLCGRGNNGGDGFVAARLLKEHRRYLRVYIYLACGEPKTGLSQAAYSKLSDDIEIITIDKLLKLNNRDMIVDCIFGTGFHGELSEDIAAFLEPLNKSNAYKLGCDMPSGVDCLNGTVAKGTLYCDETVTFHREKLGMAINPAKIYCDKISVLDIGIPDGWESYVDFNIAYTEADAKKLHNLLPKRSDYSHKGTYGKLLLICGADYYIGAAAISSRAALHTGCGIVNLAAPKSVVAAIAGHAPECVYTPLNTDNDGCISENEIEQLISLANQSTAVVVGCGIGQSNSTKKLVEALIKNVKCPMVIDADGINQLAKNIDILRESNCEIILTPHIGELARLSGTDVPFAIHNRTEVCKRLVDEYKITLHSKDATSITYNGSNAIVTSFGCSALAKGGSGDMLAGIIGSMLAQGLNVTDACITADYIMGRSAEILSEGYSPAVLTATDIIDGFKATLTAL